MGNWRTVQITGRVSPEDGPAAYDFVNIGDDWDRFHPLCFAGPSLYGLGPWIPADGGAIEAMGNLSERDYGVDSVADTLRKFAAVAPSLELKVHCGGDWESETCIATVTLQGGVVTVGPPEAATVGAGMSERGAARLFGMLYGGEAS